jgi:hypothetical protein
MSFEHGRISLFIYDLLDARLIPKFEAGSGDGGQDLEKRLSQG